jgi:ribonuclease HIII
MKKPACFVTQIDTSLVPKLKEGLASQGFTFSKPAYTIFQAKKQGISCTLFESGKLMVQGKEKDDFITYYLEPEILGNLSYSYPELEVDMNPRIGVDEAGKGDVFGPLCISAIYADKKGIEALAKMKIRDSKKISDTTVVKQAKEIKKSYAHHTVAIFPQKYNELYESFQNLNHLLAWGHATAIEHLTKKTGCKEVIIDQFADEKVVSSALKKKSLALNLTQRHRGEEDIVVAAASIIARAAFLEGLEHLSQKYQLSLPKGAAAITIKAGQRFIHSYGKEALHMVAKLHFKTVQEIIGPFFS